MKHEGKTKISIVVPVYNTAQYLPQCMDSLINQSFRDIEIIAVNDGSTDSSLDVLNQYAENDSRVRVIDKINEGVSVARNTALEGIVGEFLMFVDSDDWIELDTCQKALQVIEQYNCDVVMWSYIREFGDDSVRKKIFEKTIIYNSENVKKYIHRRFVGGIGNELSKPENLDALCPIWGKLYKTSIIKNNHIIFNDIRKIGTYEDGIFNLHLFKYVSKAVFINEFFYHYRKNNNVSITSQYNPFLVEQWVALFGLMESYIDDNQFGDIYKEALYNRIAVSIMGLGLNELTSNKSVYEKIKYIESIVSTTQYRKAYKRLNLRYFPLHWKLFFGCAKYNFATGVYLLLLAIQKIISR